MRPVEEQRMAVTEVLQKEQKLTLSDLQILRNNTAAAPLMTSKADYFSFRMEIELIDAIRALDETSTKLIEKTNLLTAVILGLTFVGVVIAALQVFVAVRHP